jgi:DNA-binding transcriptional regulator PaaX
MNDQLSIMDHLIAFLTSSRSTTIYRRNLYKRFGENHTGANETQLRRYLYRLKKKGIVRLEGDAIYVSRKKLERLEGTKRKRIKPKGTNQLIIFYDIPESMRSERRILRDQLKLWGYKFVQQSVWIGPGPLPDIFIEELKERHIYEYLHVLEIGKRR